MRIRAKKCADTIKGKHEVKVVSHIDADGITSAAIICKALDRAGIENSISFLKQLDENTIYGLADQNPELVIFTDMGSGMLEHIISSGLQAVVSDHHRPRGDPENLVKDHINPHLFGANGSTDISGSGTTYLLANELGDNRDLAGLAIVGAIGICRTGAMVILSASIGKYWKKAFLTGCYHLKKISCSLGNKQGLFLNCCNMHQSISAGTYRK
jgi:RecJ-like exonuclease